MKHRIRVLGFFRQRNSKKTAAAEVGERGDDNNNKEAAPVRPRTVRILHTVTTAPPRHLRRHRHPTSPQHSTRPRRYTPMAAASSFFPLRTLRSRRSLASLASLASSASSTTERSFGVPGLFRRRNGKKDEAAVACERGDDNKRDTPPRASTRLRLPPSEVRRDAASVTVSTLTGGWPEAIGRQGGVGPRRSPDGTGAAFESARARYYARRGKEALGLSGEKDDDASSSAFDLGLLYLIDDKHSTPGGGNEAFPTADALENARGGPREEARCHSDARVDRSGSSLFGSGLSTIDGDERTACAAKRSSSLFPHDEEFEEVSLEPESTASEETPDKRLDDALDETLAYDALDETLDETTMTSPYAFKLIPVPPDGRQVRPSAPLPRYSRDDGPVDASDSTAAEDAGCPLPPGMEEVLGSCSDLQLAFRKVLHAFFVSEEDVGAIADILCGAETEVRDTYRQKLEERATRGVSLSDSCVSALRGEW